MPEAATPTGGAEGSARPSAAPAQAAAKPTTPAQSQQQQSTPNKPATIQDRLKSALFSTPEPQADEGRALAAPPDDAEADAVEIAPQAAPDGEAGTPAGDTPDAAGEGEAAEAAEAAEANIKSVKDLAEGLGWETDRVMDLEVPVKINGKEGSVPLREALKSYQLEGHLNQGLMKLAEERKGFEAETARLAGELKARVDQSNQAVGLLQRMLDGEYAGVDWPELQRTDPLKFQSEYGAYKMRQDGIQQLNQKMLQEKALVEAQEKAAFEAYRSEQAKLLDTKFPEWADKGKRDKDVTELVAIGSDAYGFTEQEIKACVDHRQILMLRDAIKWQRLQKQKPATLNKVRAAPKLIRPGTQQSRSAQEGLELQKDRAKLRNSGKVSDATPLFKKLLFPTH